MHLKCAHMHVLYNCYVHVVLAAMIKFSFLLKRRSGQLKSKSLFGFCVLCLVLYAFTSNTLTQSNLR